MKEKKLNNHKQLRQRLSCRVQPTTRELIDMVARSRGTSVGRAVDYLARAASITIMALDKAKAEKGSQ